jgi:hypothetical protein
VEKEVTRGLNDRLLKKPYKINDYESVPCPICDGGKKTEIERWEEINSLSDFKRLLGDTHTYGI